ncbi:nitroreductase family protein [Thalassoroseus pseudoceratinae]|uniref:nitroreductase family protein n=1 Tax=Thalassoroseus pseudoceratinae TaxID=2713176 RepID=UPI0014235096
MDKPAETSFEVHEFIRDRWSPRGFADKSVEDAQLGSLLEAARWAASSYNEQPWQFFVATKRQPMEYQKLLACLVEFNQSWAQTAPVLLLSVASTRFARNGKPNQHAWHDVGLASAGLCMQATSMGLVCHGMAGFNAAKARTALQIPDGYEPVAAWAIGYQSDDLSVLPENLREQEQQPRERKPLSDFVFTGSWGQSAAFLKSD